MKLRQEATTIDLQSRRHGDARSLAESRQKIRCRDQVLRNFPAGKVTRPGADQRYMRAPFRGRAFAALHITALEFCGHSLRRAVVAEDEHQRVVAQF